MTENTANLLKFPAEAPRNALEEILREGARKLLSQAIHEEVATYLETRATLIDETIDLHDREILSNVVYEVSQAAARSPFTNFTPAITSGSMFTPFRDRHRL